MSLSLKIVSGLFNLEIELRMKLHKEIIVNMHDCSFHDKKQKSYKVESEVHQWLLVTTEISFVVKIFLKPSWGWKVTWKEKKMIATPTRVSIYFPVIFCPAKYFSKWLSISLWSNDCHSSEMIQLSFNLYFSSILAAAIVGLLVVLQVVVFK